VKGNRDGGAASDAAAAGGGAREDDGAFRPDLDCPRGLRCTDYECQRRHFDAIEHAGRRCACATTDPDDSQFRCPANPKVVVTASPDMGRTASTWVYNAVRLLFRRARVACDSYWIRNLSEEKIRLRLATAATTAPSRPRQSAHVLIKTHEVTGMSVGRFEREVAPLLDCVIVSVREGFPTDPLWMKHATCVVRYEDIVAWPSDDGSGSRSDRPLDGAQKVLRKLADHVGLGSDLLSDDDIRAVDYELMTLPIPGDQSTKFWAFHARRGGRPQPPAAAAHPSCDSVTSCGDVLVSRHGARIDNGSGCDRDWLRKAEHGCRHDPHLSPSGRTAALELAAEIVARRQLAQNGHVPSGESKSVVISYVVSSPFIRCVETAHAVAEALDVMIQIEPGISEVGSKPLHIAYSQEQLISKFPGRIDVEYKPVMDRSELSSTNEYSDTAAARRAEAVAREVRRRLPTSNGGGILFVGHGASCLGIVRAFGTDGYIGYCSLSHFRWTSTNTGVQPTKSFDETKGRWRLIGQLGDVSHLSDKDAALDSAW